MKTERCKMQEENPLIQIKKIRRRDNIKRAILKIIVFILIFSLGFSSGILYTSDFSVKEAIKTLIDSDKKAEPEIKADPKKEALAIENEKLSELKDEFVLYVKNKYPLVDLSFSIKNLETGAHTTYNNKKMNSASLIKLFIMETVFDEMKKGSYELSEEKEKELGLMITESKNTSANLFVDDFGGVDDTRKVTEQNIINKNIKARGYKYTEINRKMHDKTPPEGPSGYQNYTSSEDVLTILEGIYSKTRFDEPYNSYALNLLKNQTRRSKIPAKIFSKYPGITVANKTGELSQVENDAALILSDDFKLIFVVLIDNIPLKENGDTDYNLKNEVQVTISDLGLKLVEFYKENTF